MAFILKSNPTLRDVARVADDARGDPLGKRILDQHSLRLAVDDECNAYMLAVSSTCRQNSSQNHYMFFFAGRFFHLRTRNFSSREVCFYEFPKEFESRRADVQSCFGDAAAVFGWHGNPLTQADNALFVPVFTADDWEPDDL
jgi:hypothetical protein